MAMASKFYNGAIRKIFSMLSKSPNSQQYLLHARNTLQWMESIRDKMALKDDSIPIVSDIWKIAALGHDIEHVLPDRLQRGLYQDYTSYRQESHVRSSGIIRDILLEFGASRDESEIALKMISDHESGVLKEPSAILCDADALSYCDILVTFECKKYLSLDDMTKKINWECNRMSPYALDFLSNFYYAYMPNLNNVMLKILEERGLKQKTVNV